MDTIKTLACFMVLSGALLWMLVTAGNEICDRRAAKLQMTGHFVPLAGCFIHTPVRSTVPAHVAESDRYRTDRSAK